MSLSDYVLRELEYTAACAPDEEIFEEAARSGVELSTEQILSALHEGRAEHESR